MSVTFRPAINIKACDVCGIDDLNAPHEFWHGGSYMLTKFNCPPGCASAADVRTIDLCEWCRERVFSAVRKEMQIGKCKGVEIEPGAHSGCDAKATGATDCPECGDSKP